MPVCRIKEEFEQAIDTFLEQDVAAIITQLLAYSRRLNPLTLERAGVRIVVLNNAGLRPDRPGRLLQRDR